MIVAEPEKELLVTRTVTLTWRAPMSMYPGMTPQEAADYERNLPESDKLETMVLALTSGFPSDFGETVRIQDVLPAPVVPDTTQPLASEEGSHIRDLVFLALNNAAGNGYEADIMSLAPEGVAEELSDLDADLAEYDTMRLLPFVVEWQSKRGEAK